MPKIAEAIAARMKGKKAPGNDDDEDSSYGLEDCLQTMGEALAKKDWKGAAKEFRKAVSIAQE